MTYSPIRKFPLCVGEEILLSRTVFLVAEIESVAGFTISENFPLTNFKNKLTVSFKSFKSFIHKNKVS